MGKNKKDKVFGTNFAVGYDNSLSHRERARVRG
jgi:hypothetical protein